MTDLTEGGNFSRWNCGFEDDDDVKEETTKVREVPAENSSSIDKHEYADDSRAKIYLEAETTSRVDGDVPNTTGVRIEINGEALEDELCGSDVRTLEVTPPGSDLTIRRAIIEELRRHGIFNHRKKYRKSNGNSPKGRNMELKANASTDDLLSFETGGHSQGAAQATITSMGSFASNGQLSQNTTPGDTPSGTPSTSRKVKPALKLNIEESSWSQPPKKVPTTKFRRNLQAGAARFSAVVQRSRTPEFRFRIVLVLLFSCIVSMVTFTWYLYQRQMLQLAAGDKIQFIESQRVLHLMRGNGKELLRGVLGLHIPSELSPYDCQVLDKTKGPNICMEWKYRARLKITFTHEENVSCYQVQWQSHSTETQLRDCFILKGAEWYGMGELRNATWPLRETSISLQPFVTGDLNTSDFGAFLGRYWLSSEGVAIQVDPEIPLLLSFNESGNSNLCLESRYSKHPYTAMYKEFPKLNYTICTAVDSKIVHLSMIQKFVELPKNSTPVNEFLQSPLWATSPKLRETGITQESLKGYANHVIGHGFDEPGFIVLDPSWQNKEGDFVFQETNIPSPREILSILQNKGFKILLTVHPYVCLNSKAFYNGTEGNRFISDSVWKVPLLMRLKSQVCAIIDLTNNDSASWFISRLEDIKTRYKLDGFIFIGGQSSFLPRSYNVKQPSVNPDYFLTHYAQQALHLGPLTGLSFGYQSQSFFTAVRLSPRTSTWGFNRGLRSIIPTVLNLGLLGYPLINPGGVGGDEFIENGVSLPHNELYLRWLQLAVFMPVLQFSVPPGDYSLREIKVAKVLLKIRQERVVPVMQRCLQQFLETGAPIIRPLWWLASDDQYVHHVDSQFSVGDEIIVAPVTEEGKTNREVYLPPGFWKDEIQATTRRGGRWLHNYSVPLDKVAYFIRTDDPNK